MTTEELVDKYQTALEEMSIAESDGEDSDDWSIQAADAARELKGRTVAASVKWQNGRVTEAAGEVISIAGDKVYLETAFGAVEGDANTMSAV